MAKIRRDCLNSLIDCGNASKSNLSGYAAAGLEASLHDLLTSARLTRVLTHCTWENTKVAISKCGSKVGRFVSGTDMPLWVDMVAREGEWAGFFRSSGTRKLLLFLNHQAKTRAHQLAGRVTGAMAALAPLPPPVRSRHRRVATRASPISRPGPAASLIQPVPDSDFGRVMDGRDLLSMPFAERRAILRRALDEGSGLVIVPNLANISPTTLVELSHAVGDVVEKNPGVAPEYLIPNVPEVQVIGNAKDERGELRAMFSRAPPLPTDDVTGEPTLRYDPDARSPVWHTDQAFRDPPPFASLLYCKKSPPLGAGGDTAFADMTAACNALDPNRRATLRKLRAVCSYAHHNAKVNKRTPTYPLLTPAQRRLHPPVYQNIIRVDTSTGTESLYGFSSAVCAVVDEDAAVSTADLDRYDLDGEEDASVRALMYENLLPFATGPEFTYRHVWSDGDLVIWDNLRTIHTATPFEERYEREMWRTTVAHEAGGEAYLGASIG